MGPQAADVLVGGVVNAGLGGQQDLGQTLDRHQSVAQEDWPQPRSQEIIGHMALGPQELREARNPTFVVLEKILPPKGAHARKAKLKDSKAKPSLKQSIVQPEGLSDLALTDTFQATPMSDNQGPEEEPLGPVLECQPGDLEAPPDVGPVEEASDGLFEVSSSEALLPKDDQELPKEESSADLSVEPRPGTPAESPAPGPAEATGDHPEHYLLPDNQPSPSEDLPPNLPEDSPGGAGSSDAIDKEEAPGAPKDPEPPVESPQLNQQQLFEEATKVDLKRILERLEEQDRLIKNQDDLIQKLRMDLMQQLETRVNLLIQDQIKADEARNTQLEILISSAMDIKCQERCSRVKEELVGRSENLVTSEMACIRRDLTTFNKVNKEFLRAVRDRMTSYDIKMDQCQQRLDKAVVDLDSSLEQGQVEMTLKMDQRLDNFQKSVDRANEKLLELTSVYDDVQDKIWEMEKSWRNNLVFHGVLYDEPLLEEPPFRTEEKVREIIRVDLQISREIPILKAQRIKAGPLVRGTHPITVTFQNYSDKEDVLRRAKLIRGTEGACGVAAIGSQLAPGLYITEDASRKAREARAELVRFWREIRKRHPEKQCSIRTDRLYVDKDHVYAWNEKNQRIERVGPAGPHWSGSTPSLLGPQPSPSPAAQRPQVQKYAESLNELDEEDLLNACSSGKGSSRTLSSLAGFAMDTSMTSSPNPGKKKMIQFQQLSNDKL